MYEAVADPFCYPGTTVLKNIPGLREQRALDEFEAAVTTQRADEPLPIGRLSVSHYRAIHRHLFQDVFAWAGQYRTVRLSKGASAFCFPEYIPTEMKKLFARLKRNRYLRDLRLDSFSSAAADFVAELNAIHPFREGNGRAQLSFLALLAHQADHPLSLNRLPPEAFLATMIASFHGETRPLAAQIRALAE